MDMERLERELRTGKNAAALERLTGSEAAAELAARFDGAAVERAVRTGDGETLAALVKTILATPEGRRFAGEVRKAVDGHGG